MGSVNDLEEVQYLYHFQNSNHSQLLNDATLQNCLEPAKIEIRTQVDDALCVPSDSDPNFQKSYQNLTTFGGEILPNSDSKF